MDPDAPREVPRDRDADEELGALADAEAELAALEHELNAIDGADVTDRGATDEEM